MPTLLLHLWYLHLYPSYLTFALIQSFHPYHNDPQQHATLSSSRPTTFQKQYHPILISIVFLDSINSLDFLNSLESLNSLDSLNHFDYLDYLDYVGLLTLSTFLTLLAISSFLILLNFLTLLTLLTLSTPLTHLTLLTGNWYSYNINELQYCCNASFVQLLIFCTQKLRKHYLK